MHTEGIPGSGRLFPLSQADVLQLLFAMSGFWHTTAIATTTGALFSLANGAGQPLAQLPLPQPLIQPLTQPLTQDLPEQTVDIEVLTPDETAAQNYARAMDLANRAVIAYQAAASANVENDRDRAHLHTRRERALWQQTLAALASIPPDADSYQQAQLKLAQYQGLLATAESKLAAADNAFLLPIIQTAALNPEQVHITLCQLDDGRSNTINRPGYGATGDSGDRPGNSLIDSSVCRHHQGDQPLASPASLIKLPIAIALMDKVNRESIPLTQKIYIDPSNFTENAEGASIDIEQDYTLSQVVTRMLSESNNIATNQLIDFIGREAIAQTLADRGYEDTLVDYKLAGDRILPPNPGTQSNQSTSHDITAMMVQIYGLEHPGDADLIQALHAQRDHELGHQALQDLSESDLGEAVVWLGEKTGQNDRVIASTLAMEIDSQRYVLTVAIDHSGDAGALRGIIRGVADYLLAEGGFND